MVDKWSATMELFSNVVLKTFLFALIKSIVQQCGITANTFRDKHEYSSSPLKYNGIF